MEAEGRIVLALMGCRAEHGVEKSVVVDGNVAVDAAAYNKERLATPLRSSWSLVRDTSVSSDGAAGSAVVLETTSPGPVLRGRYASESAMNRRTWASWLVSGGGTRR